jgi:hypothetical protein
MGPLLILQEVAQNGIAQHTLPRGLFTIRGIHRKRLANGLLRFSPLAGPTQGHGFPDQGPFFKAVLLIQRIQQNHHARALERQQSLIDPIVLGSLVHQMTKQSFRLGEPACRQQGVRSRQAHLLMLSMPKQLHQVAAAPPGRLLQQLKNIVVATRGGIHPGQQQQLTIRLGFAKGSLSGGLLFSRPDGNPRQLHRQPLRLFKTSRFYEVFNQFAPAARR